MLGFLLHVWGFSRVVPSCECSKCPAEPSCLVCWEGSSGSAGGCQHQVPLGEAQPWAPGPSQRRRWGRGLCRRSSWRGGDTTEEPIAAPWGPEGGLWQGEGLRWVVSVSPAQTAPRCLGALSAACSPGAPAFSIPRRGSAEGCVCHPESPQASAELCVPAIKPC